MRIAASKLQRGLGVFRLRLREELLDRRQQKRERRAELMAHIGKELRLGAVDLRELLGALPLGRVGFGVGNSSGDLPGNQAEEAAVARVKLAEWVEGRDENAGATARADLERQQHARLRRLRPGSHRQLGGTLERVRLQRLGAAKDAAQRPGA